MYKKIILSFAIIGTLTFQNCKPTEPDPLPGPITAPEIVIPSGINNVDGILVAIMTSSKNLGADLVVGSAYAAFYKSKNPVTKLEAGSVKINTKIATKSDDNIYFYTSSAAEPKGIEYKGQVLWQVSGSTVNDVPVINDNSGTVWPNTPVVPEFINLSGTQDYLLKWNSSFGGDSAIVILKGPSGTFKKVFNNSVSSYTIPKTEIAKLGAGSGNLQVINYKIELKTYGTKSYAFLHEAIVVCNKLSITQ